MKVKNVLSFFVCNYKLIINMFIYVINSGTYDIIKDMKEQVYEYLTKIPHEKVVTYKQIAEYLGNSKLARVVGNILHDNKYPDIYPCFKVVNSKGYLASHYAYGGIKVQKQRLENDGILVKDNRVDLDIYKWGGL